MKNKENLKKYIIYIIISFLIFLSLLTLINIMEFKSYSRNNNLVIVSIVENIKKSYPEADINQIINILNSENLVSNDAKNNNIKENILEEYGIDINEDVAILNNQKSYITYLIVSILVILLFMILCIFLAIKYSKKQYEQISEITKYIEEINKGIYNLNIQQNSEDELSILRNEVYKITVNLREQSQNNLNDKILLKKSLEDISHQLKTPLTSITIMLDNLIDNKNMDEDTRNDFLKSIYREISNMKFFIQSLLKLSKFDANTIVFNSKAERLEDIITGAIQNTSVLCDLKNIKINVRNMCDNKNITVKCDLKWQIEAVTNILKNSIEHSNENSYINIYYNENNMYSEIIIEDNGEGIDKEDLKHIFERFYKGKNQSSDSVGIGLSLAKTIIEKDKGYIKVDSEKQKGTKFYIRYLK